jgi:hypothetical protein
MLRSATVKSRARTKERRLFRNKARQLEKAALVEIERHRSIPDSRQDSHKFYKRLNDVKRPFEPQVDMCRAKNGVLLTNKNQVALERGLRIGATNTCSRFER